jgi:hypothetical protein
MKSLLEVFLTLFVSAILSNLLTQVALNFPSYSKQGVANKSDHTLRIIYLRNEPELRVAYKCAEVLPIDAVLPYKSRISHPQLLQRMYNCN